VQNRSSKRIRAYLKFNQRRTINHLACSRHTNQHFLNENNLLFPRRTQKAARAAPGCTPSPPRITHVASDSSESDTLAFNLATMHAHSSQPFPQHRRKIHHDHRSFSYASQSRRTFSHDAMMERTTFVSNTRCFRVSSGMRNPKGGLPRRRTAIIIILL